MWRQAVQSSRNAQQLVQPKTWSDSDCGQREKRVRTDRNTHRRGKHTKYRYSTIGVKKHKLRLKHTGTFCYQQKVIQSLFGVQTKEEESGIPLPYIEYTLLFMHTVPSLYSLHTRRSTVPLLPVTSAVASISALFSRSA